MTIRKEIEISDEVDIEIDLDDIVNSLSSYEKDELLDILLLERNKSNHQFYLQNIITGMSDSEILTNKSLWDKIIKLMKYENSELLEYIIEELSYTPSR